MDTLQTTTQAPDALAIEATVIAGDLSKLTPAQRVSYYQSVCRSLGLNPLTRPFDYITLNGKLTLYARKDATDQLRGLKGISIDKPDITFQDDWIVVTVSARDASGRSDADVGVVSRKDMRGDFGNSLMKAVTKAKRRVTLSICGLGMTDESEVETIPQAQAVAINHQTGEILNGPRPSGPEATPLDARGVGCITEKQQKRLFAIARDAGWSSPEIKALLLTTYHIDHSRDIPIDLYEEIIGVIQSGRGETEPAEGDL